MSSYFQALSQPDGIRFGWALIHMLWQGVIIATFLEVALLFVRRKNAAVRYIVCGVAVALMPVCLAGTYWFLGGVSHNEAVIILPDKTTADPSIAGDESSPGTSSPPSKIFVTSKTSFFRPFDLNPYMPVVVMVWFMGVVVLGGRKAGGFYVVWRLRHQGLIVPTNVLLEQFRRVCLRLGVDSDHVCLKISSLIAVPMTIGWFKPLVLFPASLLSGLTSDEIGLLLAHELAHIRRHDYLANILQTMMETIFFYHPVTWWISRRMKQE